MKSARHLDVDDLYILSMLADGASVTDIARTLCVTQPAVSLRLAKIKRIFGVFYHKHKCTIVLTEKGKTLTTCARACVELLSTL